MSWGDYENSDVEKRESDRESFQSEENSRHEDSMRNEANRISKGSYWG